MDTHNETLHSWNKVAKLYQDMFMDLDLYNHTYDLLCSLLPVNARVLEIGCGPGNMTKYIGNKRPDIMIEAIDNASNMIELARQNNPDATYRVMDCRDIDTINAQFDAIVCGFCLPYLSEHECAKLFSDCKNLFVPNGSFYVSFVEGPPALSGYQTGSSGDRMYFYYHQLTTIQSQLETNGFKPVQLFHVDYPKKEGTTEVHTILIVQC